MLNSLVYKSIRETVRFEAFMASRSVIGFAGSPSASIKTYDGATPRDEIIIPDSFSFFAELCNVEEVVATVPSLYVNAKVVAVIVLDDPVDGSVTNLISTTLHTPLTRHAALRHIRHKPWSSACYP